MYGRGEFLVPHSEILEILLHEQSRDRLGHEFDYCRRGGVRAMRRAESIVDIDAAQRRRLLRKFRIILLFLSVIPEVLQQ